MVARHPIAKPRHPCRQSFRDGYSVEDAQHLASGIVDYKQNSAPCYGLALLLFLITNSDLSITKAPEVVRVTGAQLWS